MNPVRLAQTSHANQSHSRRGQALLEFAFITVILLFLIGGTFSLAYFFYAANTLQMAVDVAAQEISRMPYDPDETLGLGGLDGRSGVATDQAFRDQIYDEQHLVVEVGDLGGQSLGDYAQTLPLLNRLLVNVMIFDADLGVYRYPGTVVRNAEGQETVMIPVVEYDADGTESFLRWVAPVEEIRQSPNDPTTGPYRVTSSVSNGLAGVVALRINYPAQAAGLINRSTSGAITGATDLASLSLGSYELVSADDEGYGPHAGRLGLGRMAAPSTRLANGVRPYRRVLSAQAIYRREVFE